MITLYTMEREYPYGTLRSTNGSKVKIVLEEKGLAYRCDYVRPSDVWKKVPEVLAKHPLGKVPWIQEDDFTLYDSTVINEYLNEKVPEHPLLPENVLSRARVRALENYADEGVLSKYLPMIWMPWWVPEEQRDLDQMQRGRDGLRAQVFPFITDALGEHDYLCGDFTLADVPMMTLAMVLQVDGMSMEEYPKVGAYLGRLRLRDSYASINPDRGRT